MLNPGATSLDITTWEIPDFSVRRYGKKLIALHRDVTASRIGLKVVFHSLLSVARRVDR